MNKSKTFGMGITAVLLIGIGIVSYFVFAQNGNKPPAVPHPSNSPMPINIWEKTSTYHDDKYGYSLTYPDTILDVDDKLLEKVSFIESDSDYGRVSIAIESTDFKMPREWFDTENARLLRHPDESEYTLVLEKEAVLDGCDAIIVHGKNKIEEFPYEKTTVCIRNGNLFKISTRVISDLEWVYANLKFDK